MCHDEAAHHSDTIAHLAMPTSSSPGTDDLIAFVRHGNETNRPAQATISPTNVTTTSYVHDAV
jgi:hypothetical protein